MPTNSMKLIMAMKFVANKLLLFLNLLAIAITPKNMQHKTKGKGTYLPGEGMHLVLS